MVERDYEGFDPREASGEEDLSEEQVKAKQILEQRIAMLEKDGMKLATVDEADRCIDICRAALVQNGMALQFVPEGMRDMYLCQKALRTTGLALQFVPDSLRSKAVCMLALRHDGLALQYVPEKTRDRDVCRTAVTQDSLALQFVPEELVDEELCTHAMRVDGRALEFVPMNLRTPMMCFEACRTNGMALEFVPDELRTDLVRVRGLFSAGATVSRMTKIVCLTPPDWEEMSKAKPRDEWGKFERWSFDAPEEFPCPERFAPSADEVHAFLKNLALEFAQKAEVADFEQRAEEAKSGNGFWLDVLEEESRDEEAAEGGEKPRRKTSIYGPSLALLCKMELDAHGIPEYSGAFAAATKLMDWAAGWHE